MIIQMPKQWWNQLASKNSLPVYRSSKRRTDFPSDERTRFPSPKRGEQASSKERVGTSKAFVKVEMRKSRRRSREEEESAISFCFIFPLVIPPLYKGKGNTNYMGIVNFTELDYSFCVLESRVTGGFWVMGPSWPSKLLTFQFENFFFFFLRNRVQVLRREN